MNFEQQFPLRYYLNLGRREDRRTELEWHLDQVEVTAERFPAIDARFCRSARGYENKGRYALALTIRLAIRRAKRMKASALLLLEDDAILHPNFRELISRIELPEDWGIFYLGCQHTQRPEPCGEGLVRVKKALDSHAWAIHESAYDEVMAAMDAHGKPCPDHALASDQFVAELHEGIPTYACYPNLAWQSVDESDLTGTTYSLYGSTGHQRNHLATLDNLLTECLAPEALGKEPKLALLFLTRGDVNHPNVWQEWISQGRAQIALYSHPKNPDEIEGGFLDGTAIDKLIATGWGQVSLVQATLALLAEALKDEDNTHFVLLSESCVPIQPLARLLLRLKYDGRSRFGFKNFKEASLVRKQRAATAPDIPEGCWRFHQQWWLLDRAAAVMVTRSDRSGQFGDYLASDEAYFGTNLMMEGYPVDDLVDDRDLTWTHWPHDSGRPEEFLKISSEQLRDLVNSDCFFARKFPPGADIANYDLHGRSPGEEVSQEEMTGETDSAS